ncbi:HD domain-containing protein (plasmid) [Deinococcus sp. KNUC1210]|uniref:HD-GYP domain-containing protein n=1 Tax=Deinococcus sp. KNUC1210 TaxID=2917691 RepID=UPI001EF110DB|nr:HD domain-containing phosphohydrolase [Deinococcus sp. KNUC1210]ULH14100.1 HD domain-containing protein [Deinococcus sp. KNUC1210]
MLLGWMASLGLCDDGHLPRVMMLTLALCERLNMLESAVERRIALRAGLLHDIGKALVSQDILNKAGPLSLEERIVIERHPELGARLAANLQGIEPEVIQAILHHHEAYGGEGYPYGLTGLQIPRLARVLSVADVYDALTSDRPYRSAWTHEEAVKYLKEHTGRIFDPVAVWALSLFHFDPRDEALELLHHPS